MNITCPSCKARYAVDDARIPPTGATIRCPSCHHTFVAHHSVSGPAPFTPPTAHLADETPLSAYIPPASAVPLPGGTTPSGASPPAPVPLPGNQPLMPSLSTDSRPTQPGGEVHGGPSEPPPVLLPGQTAGSHAAGAFALPPIEAHNQRPTAISPHPSSPTTTRDLGDLHLGFEGDNGSNGLNPDAFNPDELNFIEELNSDALNSDALNSDALNSDALNFIEELRPDALNPDAFSSDLIHSDPLNFIEETRQKASADLRAEEPIEYFVRYRSGKIDGPMGLEHIKAQLRAGVFNGDEDVSEDANQWWALSSDTRLGAAIPIKPATKGPRSSMDELLGSLDLIPPTPDIPLHEQTPLPGHIDELQVDAIPPRHSLLLRRYQTLAVVVVGLMLSGGAMWLIYTSVVGLMSQDREVPSTTSTEDLARQSPAPLPGLDDAMDRSAIQTTLQQGAFQGFRSTLSTLESASRSPEHEILYAKVLVWAGLHFGTEHFPLAKTQSAALSLPSAPSNSTHKLDITKIRGGLALLEGEHTGALTALRTAASNAPEDPELAFLLGIAEEANGNEAAALAAYDQAIVLAPKYAAAYLRIGHMHLAQKKLNDATFWLEKARLAQPQQASAAYLLANIYQRRSQLGAYRRVLADAGRAASIGLPPKQRNKVLWEAVRAYDEINQLKDIPQLARELSRVAPQDPVAGSYKALADALQGNVEPALKALNELLIQHPKHLKLLIARARTHMLRGHIAKALLDLEQARSLDKGTEVLLWQARFNLEIGKTVDAARALRMAVRRTDQALPLVMLARITRRDGKLDEAMDRAKAAISSSKTDILGHLEIGHIHLQRGDWAGAEEAFRRALTIDNQNLSANLGLANALREQAAQHNQPTTSMKLAEAIPLYLTHLNKYPRDPQGVFEYGRVLELQGDRVGALELYTQAATMDKQDVRPHLKMAAAHLQQNPPDINQARTSLQKAQSIEEHSGQLVGDVRLWEARLAMHTGHPSKAENAMRKALQIKPNYAEYHYWHGRALELNSALFEAIGAYKKALRFNDNLVEAYRALGQAELERFRFEAARKNFRTYLRKKPQDATIWMDIGRSFSRQNRDNEALKAFNRVLKSLPNFVNAHLQIGQIMSRRGEEGRAQQHFQKATKLAPQNAEAWCMLGLSLGQVRLTRAAQKALNQCIILPDSPPNLVETARQVLQE